MISFILLIFYSGEHVEHIKFMNEGACERARSKIAHTFDNYIAPKTVCVKEG